ncbi:oxidoreductase domain protein [Halothece sp. PCC 7418]|uniref:Gfo/Idh/MocA family protein n=1 Tax=Halothece sp. (strain PCC 7418) TaxID=65093 RepID=UPI0002A06592|nr:Gfo/Idh/MocA family oxidoreductase [Halothece sp. PCC 7418]AFZ45781.1 oxidoreductase domain protein [Halothece sp. PCC 7418]
MTKLIRIGIIGTGFAAQRRAEAFAEDDRAEVIAVAGHRPESRDTFCQTYSIKGYDSPQELIANPDLDLVVICNINAEHGNLAQAALEADKHVVVEYPLSLNPEQAQYLITLAKQKNKLLHVEHIELLGGLHNAIREWLPKIGNVFYARYSTINPQRPAPDKWTYHKQLFGFPFSGALSRFHRFTDLFGKVNTVNCYTRYWERENRDQYLACLNHAQLQFETGLLADVIYGKGEVFWQPNRDFELHGDQGTLIFVGSEGKLVRGEEETPIEVGSRRGLFAKDTAFVLDYLTANQPLYLPVESSYYATRVADAARVAAETGKTIFLEK